MPPLVPKNVIEPYLFPSSWRRRGDEGLNPTGAKSAGMQRLAPAQGGNQPSPSGLSCTLRAVARVGGEVLPLGEPRDHCHALGQQPGQTHLSRRDAVGLPIPLRSGSLSTCHRRAAYRR